MKSATLQRKTGTSSHTLAEVYQAPPGRSEPIRTEAVQSTKALGLKTLRSTPAGITSTALGISLATTRIQAKRAPAFLKKKERRIKKKIKLRMKRKIKIKTKRKTNRRKVSLQAVIAQMSLQVARVMIQIKTLMILMRKIRRKRRRLRKVLLNPR